MNPAATVSMIIPPSPDAPGIARATVAHALRDSGAAEDACLVVSELVTNAVVHGDPVEIRVAIRVFDEFGRIEVTSVEREHEMAPPERPPQPEGIGGYGLAIVDRLSDHWGVQNSSTFWSEINLVP